jgi:methionyl aminopeptidase
MIEIKSKREIELIEEACKIVALVHKKLEETIRPGITTFELDRIAEKIIKEQRWYSCPKRISKLSKKCTRFP